eukprot:scaffold99687_cov63-Phaeocystis_antarctica.AAC.2
MGMLLVAVTAATYLGNQVLVSRRAERGGAPAEGAGSREVAEVRQADAAGTELASTVRGASVTGGAKSAVPRCMPSYTVAHSTPGSAAGMVRSRGGQASSALRRSRASSAEEMWRSCAPALSAAREPVRSSAPPAPWSGQNQTPTQGSTSFHCVRCKLALIDHF